MAGQKVNGLRGLAVNKPVKKGDVILKAGMSVRIRSRQVNH